MWAEQCVGISAKFDFSFKISPRWPREAHMMIFPDAVVTGDIGQCNLPSLFIRKGIGEKKGMNSSSTKIDLRGTSNI